MLSGLGVLVTEKWTIRAFEARSTSDMVMIMWVRIGNVVQNFVSRYLKKLISNVVIQLSSDIVS